MCCPQGIPVWICFTVYVLNFSQLNTTTRSLRSILAYRFSAPIYYLGLPSWSNTAPIPFCYASTWITDFLELIACLHIMLLTL